MLDWRYLTIDWDVFCMYILSDLLVLRVKYVLVFFKPCESQHWKKTFSKYFCLGFGHKDPSQWDLVTALGSAISWHYSFCVCVMLYSKIWELLP